MELKIEKGIPVPAPIARDGKGKGHCALIRSMEVGDSVHFPDRKSATLFAGHGHMVLRGSEHSVCQRKVEGGWRVWKVKREPKPNGSGG